MSRFCYIVLIFFLIAKIEVSAQTDYFIVKLVPFSSGINDEFSPVYYHGGIVFCSNQRDNSLIGFNDDQNRLFNIFYVGKKEGSGWKRSQLLAKELSTGFNDGPASFNKNGNIIYFSRNNSVPKILRNISDTLNNLGIYSAELVNGEWTNTKSFSFNDPLYSFTTPAITPEGTRLYFASDMPGGNGGMDLYYCDWRNNKWDEPVNLGPEINTSKSESFPFANDYGKLFFASDGLLGFGGKDLYYTQEINGNWITPVHLDSAINSPADDFGLVADSSIENGYFSSNRRGTDDIFSFNSPPVDFLDCDSLMENNFCFTLYDERHQVIDTIPAIYQWDFGDGIIRNGLEVRHCFPGPGSYTVKLSIFDEVSGDTISDQIVYNVDLENIEQAYIKSNNIGLADEAVFFDGTLTNLKDFRITDYYWDFGEGFLSGGSSMSTTFKRKSEITVRMGLLSAKDSTGAVRKTCVWKKIRIYGAWQEISLSQDMLKNEVGDQKPDLINIYSRLFYMDDLSERQKSSIKDALAKAGEFSLGFDKYGITKASYGFLDEIADLLNKNQDIRLEMILYEMEDGKPVEGGGLSEEWAGNFSFYLKNREVNTNSFYSKSLVLPSPILKPFVPDSGSIDGVVEFLFMKK